LGKHPQKKLTIASFPYWLAKGEKSLHESEKSKETIADNSDYPNHNTAYLNLIRQERGSFRIGIN